MPLARRTHDGSLPVDASGVLPDGGPSRAGGLAYRTDGATPSFARCLAEKLLTYAAGARTGSQRPMGGCRHHPEASR